MNQKTSPADQQKRDDSERLARQLNEFLAEQTAKEQAGAPQSA
jgi:hypothetical protein